MATYLPRLGITAAAALAAGLFTATGGVAAAAPAEVDRSHVETTDDNGTFISDEHTVYTKGNDTSRGQQVRTIHLQSSGSFTDPTGSFTEEGHGTFNTADAIAPAAVSTGVSTTTIIVEDETVTIRCVGHFTSTSGYSARSSGNVNNFQKCH